MDAVLVFGRPRDDWPAAMNGRSRATNGSAPRLPFAALLVMVVATPLIAALLDPDPQNLAAEWKESARSTLALVVFTIVNGGATLLACNLALGRLGPRSVLLGALLCSGVVLLVTPVTLFVALPAWRVLDARLFSEPGIFLVRALLLSVPWICLSWLAAAVWLPKQEAGVRGRVTALQSRLEPHFLFNALDTLAQLIATDAKTAEEMLVRLSELLRELVLLAESPLIPLERELALVKDYLAVATLRFPELQHEVRAEVTGVMVPPACVLPLVENAVLHGGGKVVVEVLREGSELVLRVRNPLGEVARERGTQTALRDLRERLRLLFDERARLVVAPTADSFVAEVRLPA